MQRCASMRHPLDDARSEVCVMIVFPGAHEGIECTGSGALEPHREAVDAAIERRGPVDVRVLARKRLDVVRPVRPAEAELGAPLNEAVG